MKQELDQESIEILTQYRLKRAKETLVEAEYLIQKKFYNATVNRLYYAAYYAVSALLVKNRITAQSHSGVKQMFGLHFITTRKLPAKLGRFYNQLFNDRITGDYDDFVDYDQEMIDDILPKTDEFIQLISEFIMKDQ